MANFIQRGNIVDIFNKRLFFGTVTVIADKIAAVRVEKEEPLPDHPFILPGFTDAHIHIESSMLVPASFAALAVVHGTVSTISDPHEIANVCGVAGVQFMIDNGNTTPFKFCFGAPSCVPATPFETAGATVNVAEVANLLARPDIYYLSEMMNYPGVLNSETEVLAKIAAAKQYGKPVDGHAPGLRGAAAAEYIAAGISTDHECFTEAEAAEKLRLGMKILIREGSAAKNFEALIGLLHDHADNMMFCSDDKHPDSLVEGHINELCARAVAKGVDVFKVLQAACVNPVLHYKTGVGLLRTGDAADFIVVKDLIDFGVLQTYINGVLVFDGHTALFAPVMDGSVINRFSCNPITVTDLAWPAPPGITPLPVIEALDGQLITNKLLLPPTITNGQISSDVAADVLKMVVVNRYNPAPVARALVKNFGLKSGAIASSVAHDSHNIIAVGVDDESLCRAINQIVVAKGGVSVAGSADSVLPLPVAGLMSAADGHTVAAAYTAIDHAAKALGSTLAAPFMTLSFMALLVIPHLKLSDMGLFDGDRFGFVADC